MKMPGVEPSEETGVELTWLGHSTVVIELGGVRLITDPLLRRRTGPLVRAEPLAAGATPVVDAVLLSHLHHDHADLTSLHRLGSEPVATGPANRIWLSRNGLAVAPVPADGWWVVPQASGSGPVEVRLVRAVHDSRRMPHRPNDTHGFLVRSRDAVVWFAGDTALYAEMAALPDLAGRAVDVALLPIGGWGPRLSDGHLGPETAAAAMALTGARTVLPVHHGTLHLLGWPRWHRGWMRAPLPAFAAALAERAPDARLLPSTPGVLVHVPAVGPANDAPTTSPPRAP